MKPQSKRSRTRRPRSLYSALPDGPHTSENKIMPKESPSDGEDSLSTDLALAVADLKTPPDVPAHGSNGFGLPAISNRRREARLPFHWKVAIVLQEASKKTYRGHTANVSPSGCMVILPCNISSDRPISLRIEIPPLTHDVGHAVVEVTGRMAYTLLSNEHHEFVAGIEFGQFKGNGQTVLQAALQARTA